MMAGYSYSFCVKKQSSSSTSSSTSFLSPGSFRFPFSLGRHSSLNKEKIIKPSGPP